MAPRPRIPTKHRRWWRDTTNVARMGEAKSGSMHIRSRISLRSFGLRVSISSLALVEGGGRRQRHAVTQRRFGEFFPSVQQDASVAAKTQFGRVQLAEGPDQIGLAMEIDRV